MLFIDKHIDTLRHSKSFKILKGFFFLYLAISGFFTCLNIYYLYQIEKFSMFQELHYIERAFRTYFIDMVSSNKLLIRVRLGELLEPTISGVKITRLDNNKLIYKIGNIKSKILPSGVEYKFLVPSVNKSKPQNFAEITIYSDFSHIISEIKINLIVNVLSFVMELLSLWVLILLFWFYFFCHERTVGLVRFIRNYLKYFISVLADKKGVLSGFSNLLPSIIIMLNEEGCIIEFNNTAEQFFGKNAEDVIGRPIQELIKELDLYVDEIKESFNLLICKTFNKVKTSINNSDVFLKIFICPFEDKGISLYIDDITERIFVENLLIQTEKMTTLGTLSAGMAHEINNALSGILQGIQNITRRLDVNNGKNLEIAKENGISLEHVQKYLELRGINTFISGIRELGGHSSTVVKNVLRFSRRSDDEMINANVNSIIQDAISIISTDYEIKKQMRYSNLIVNTEFDHKIPNIYCIPSEIEQVVINLIKNAAYALIDKDFIKENEKPTIIIKTINLTDRVRIEVSDNGPGISNHVKQNLFKPFFTTKPIGVGTGLGLSISRYIIVDKHHGDLTLESTVGMGTTFIIDFPVH